VSPRECLGEEELSREGETPLHEVKSGQARQARQAICGGAGGEPPRVLGGRGIIS